MLDRYNCERKRNPCKDSEGISFANIEKTRKNKPSENCKRGANNSAGNSGNDNNVLVVVVVEDKGKANKQWEEVCYLNYNEAQKYSFAEEYEEEEVAQGHENEEEEEEEVAAVMLLLDDDGIKRYGSDKQA
eukprot:4475334-Ditylum_brightwellii.AAC.1